MVPISVEGGVPRIGVHVKSAHREDLLLDAGFVGAATDLEQALIAPPRAPRVGRQLGRIGSFQTQTNRWWFLLN